MGKNIVILSGSPRRKGNTEKLISAFKEGAEATGNTVTIFHTARMNIKGCIGCELCTEREGKCSLSDDMDIILDAMNECDMIIWASPIYYFSFTAQLKAVIDRTYPLVNKDKKQAGLMLTFAYDNDDTAAGAVAIYERILQYYEWEDAFRILVPSVEHENDIDGRSELELARKIGNKIL